MPAATLMVRSCGSYWMTPRRESVLIATSAGSMGPAMRRLEELPASAMVWPADGRRAEGVGQFGGIRRGHHVIG